MTTKNKKFFVSEKQFFKLHSNLKELEKTLSLGLSGHSFINPDIIDMIFNEYLFENNLEIILNSNFIKISSKVISIPSNYQSIHIEDLEKAHYYYVNPNITNNLYYSSDKLTPGKEYNLEIYEPIGKIHSFFCYLLLKNRGGKMCGINLLLLLALHYPEVIPPDSWILSFDNKEYLFKDNNKKHRIPGLYVRDKNEFALSLISSLEEGIDNSHCPVFIPCITDKDDS